MFKKLLVYSFLIVLISSCDDCENIDCFDTSNNFIFVRYFDKEHWAGDLDEAVDFFEGRQELLHTIKVGHLIEGNNPETGRIIFKPN
jgi:hypothetical protein